jgi:hypothetical protein
VRNCEALADSHQEGSRKSGEVKPISRSGDATAIRSRKKSTLSLASRHRIVVALVGDAPLRTEGSTSRRL